MIIIFQNDDFEKFRSCHETEAEVNIPDQEKKYLKNV